ncbi:DUF3887 domain-containing protein [Nocardia nepalensis]|uniref:DUF3887 domain-containing protein n=1 Tax=Nocardia nepalensis TaxID=3375448 RepID=UPI003B67455F
MVIRSNKATTVGADYRLITFAVLIIGALTLVSACGSNTRTSEEVTSATATPAAKEAQSRDDQLALQTLDSIVRADFTAATSHFDDAMKKKLSPDGIASGWAAYQKEFGRYQSHGDPQNVTQGDLTVVNVPLTMERAPGEFRVTFHKDATIAGLFLLKAGAP